MCLPGVGLVGMSTTRNFRKAIEDKVSVGTYEDRARYNIFQYLSSLRTICSSILKAEFNNISCSMKHVHLYIIPFSAKQHSAKIRGTVLQHFQQHKN